MKLVYTLLIACCLSARASTVVLSVTNWDMSPTLPGWIRISWQGPAVLGDPVTVSPASRLYSPVNNIAPSAKLFPGLYSVAVKDMIFPSPVVIKVPNDNATYQLGQLVTTNTPSTGGFAYITPGVQKITSTGGRLTVTPSGGSGIVDLDLGTLNHLKVGDLNVNDNTLLNSDGSISVAGGTVQVTAEGVLIAGAGNLTVDTSAGNLFDVGAGTFGGGVYTAFGVGINSDSSANLGGGNFHIDANGNVSLTGGATISGLPRMLAASSGPEQSDAAPKTLFTRTVPANTFTKAGDSFEWMLVFLGDSFTSLDFDYSIGGNSVYAPTEGFPAQGRYVQLTGSRLDGTTMGVQFFDINSGAADYVTATVNFAADMVFALTTSGDAGCGVTLEFAKIRFEPAP